MATNYGTFSYPGNVASNPSVGTNGSTAPVQSTQVAGENPSGNLEPLQTDASGNLLVSLAAEPLNPFNTKDAADGTVGSASPTTAIQVGGTDGTNLRAVLTDSSGHPLVIQPDVIATGNITNTQAIVLTCNGLGSAGIQITGTWTGFISFSASVDGTNFTATSALVLS